MNRSKPKWRLCDAGDDLKVFKLEAEVHDITEEPRVYVTKQKAVDALEGWSGWLGMSAMEALSSDEVRIVEWELI